MHKILTKAVAAAAVTLLAVGASAAHADVRITEIAPWSSGNSSLGQDWFELTNTGASAVDITHWSWDDDSQNPGTALLEGVTSLGAGQSVVFVDGGASVPADFVNLWFGGAAPANFVIGYYDGPGLSTGGDEVNVYDASNVLQASLNFGASPTGPYATFDNAAGLDGTSVSQLSAVSVNGAFIAANDINEIGSPGAVAAVPEPESYAMLLAGLGMIGAMARKRRA
ncbi:PEP-CTERM sorting domain-containing protein [Nitrogeniibacter mangrovi]|uniref:PEP-CTERM sorting domain-containing protein n=1 Tax=Nitrogeniibacter mangrovi TaxID=2016596 RepID=A0A6C1BAS0_9RHOO|nr:lamin tail domain-containing protein [Nitrogeniibacter mangrovi]QID19490.1 PEP-CTERM sorting domain-containing protein [Nitrogeniibacter mangrovi]